MCGIYGFVGDSKNIDSKRIDNLLRHRGPDDHGTYATDNLFLLHRRLSIQDLSILGHQPMVSDDGNFIICYNGEIYNHIEIRNQLIHKYNFKSTSDTETLLYGFIEFGVSLFNMLNGIFAFSIYNCISNELIIVRDHFGIKPLYYYCDDEKLIFSSELKAISNTDGVNISIDSKGLLNYLYYLWSPGSRTAIQQIKKLEAGHFIRMNTLSPKDYVIEKYYEIPFSTKKEIKDYKFWESELEEILLSAIERQLLSDVPIGFFLSGGLDSSLLVAMYRKLYPNAPIKAFTISTGKEFQEEGFGDDLYYAKLVAKHLEVDLTITESNIDILKCFDHMIWHLDEPQTDLAPLHVENICRQARKENCYVLLSGAGGDDLFSGYRRHQTLYHHKLLKLIPFGSSLLKFLASYVSKPMGRRIMKYISAHDSQSETMSMVNSYGWYELEGIRALFSSGIQDEIKKFDPRTLLLESLSNIPEENNVLNQMLFWDIKYFLVDHNLNYTDKLSMSQGVEVRVPYLDKDLVEFSARLPVEYKMKGTVTKYILKKLAEKYLPHEVIYRSKTGFGAPVRHWIKNDLKNLVNLKLSEEQLLKQGIFNPKEVSKLIKENIEGRVDGSYTILALLAIESFVRQFIPNQIKN